MSERPNAVTQYVDANGKLTVEGIKYLTKLADKVRELESRIETLEGYHP